MDRDKAFFEVALAKRLITWDQLREARKAQLELRRHDGRRAFLAEVMVERNMLTLEQLVLCLDLARGYREEPLGNRADARFGDLAVAKGYVTGVQLFGCLQRQRDEQASGRQPRAIGEILVAEGYLAPWELEDIVTTQADLLSGSTRSGETPSEPLPLDGVSGDPGRRTSRRVGSATRSRPQTSSARVVEVMQRSGVATSPYAQVFDARAVALESDATHLLVLHSDELVGVVSVRDLWEVEADSYVHRCMITPPCSIGVNESLADAARLLREHDAECLPVMVGGIVLGIVTRAHLAAAGVPERDLRPRWGQEELGAGG